MLYAINYRGFNAYILYHSSFCQCAEQTIVIICTRHSLHLNVHAIDDMSLSVKCAFELYRTLSVTAWHGIGVLSNRFPRHSIAIMSPILPVGCVVEENIVVEDNGFSSEVGYRTGLSGHYVAVIRAVRSCVVIQAIL